MARLGFCQSMVVWSVRRRGFVELLSGRTADNPQYSRLINTSMGVLATESAFLIVKSAREEVRSARRPKTKVKVESVRPMMVRNWRCQPNASFLCDC